jgi:hypothetical protein
VPIRGWLADLGLLGEAITVGRRFGEHSLVELARLAVFVEHAVYTPHSLALVPGGLRFLFRNPPLRLGAFDAVRLTLDGSPVPSGSAWVDVGGAGKPRRLSEVTRDAPLELLPGVATEFRADLAAKLAPGSEHVVRLDLHSVAIPPAVWVQFRDRLEGPAR